jgi:hypothetical protein
MAGIPIIAIERRPAGEKSLRGIHPRCRIENRGGRRIEAVAIEIVHQVKRHSGHAVEQCGLEELVLMLVVTAATGIGSPLE